jgi:hypothetical protein
MYKFKQKYQYLSTAIFKKETVTRTRLGEEVPLEIGAKMTNINNPSEYYNIYDEPVEHYFELAVPKIIIEGEEYV